MKKRQMLEALVIGLVVGVLVTTAGYAGERPGASPGAVTTLVSYNPAPANIYHAPISGIGLVGLTDAHPDYIARVPSGVSPPTSGGTSDPSTAMSSVPVNAMRFIKDDSYIPQTETTVGVMTSGGVTYVLGGVNDARFFFCSALPVADCPSGWTFSLSGFSLATVSNGVPTLLASDAIPGILYQSTVNPTFLGFLVSWGDPSVAVGPDGSFYYASLAIDPNTLNNGIMIAKSTSQLLTDPSSCVTPRATPWINPCWKTQFVFGSLTGFVTNNHVSHSPPTFEDKELIAVDQSPNSAFKGDVYVSWDHFFASGTSAGYLARCTPTLVCTMLAGGSAPPLSGGDPFAGFATPAVAPNGAVYVTWCNFGTFTTLGPISCRVRGSDAGGNAFGSTTTILSFDGAGTTFPDFLGLSGFATEQFRTADVPSLAAFGDASALGVASNRVYFVIDACTSRDYYGFFDPAIPGNCGQSGVLYAMSTDGGSTFSTPVVMGEGSVNVQPWVAVDPSNEHVSVVYYTSKFDPFDHRLDVLQQRSTDGGRTFSEVRVTNVSNEPDSDPAMYDYTVASGFGGSFVVPQYGDYFQAVAMGGTLYVSFCGNYASELGTLQADPFLSLVSS